MNPFCNLDDFQMHYSKWKKPDSNGYILCNSIYMAFSIYATIISTENISVVSRYNGVN